MLRVTLFKSSFCWPNVVLSRCVTFRCYVGVVYDARSEALVFQRTVVFFPAVTVFRGWCLACLDDFSVVFLDCGL